MTADDWPARLADHVAAAAARRTARRELRGHLAAARNHGLAKRHATKTSRANTGAGNEGGTA